MKQIDLRGLDPLKPAHLIEVKRGLVIGCEEMEHLRENQYQCVDNSCRIVYRHFSSAFNKEPIRCKPRCILLKRNADYNFVCKRCGDYWYFQPGQKFMLSLEDLYIQDLRVVKFLIGKLQESIKTVREVEDFSARLKIGMIEKLELHLSQLSKVYRI